jgi:transposase InsO family protein
MPWMKVDVDEQRMRFVIRAASKQEPFAKLCEEFGISRPTGYLWRRRYEQTRSLTSLAEHSRRPHRSPQRTAACQEERVVARRRETGWGAKKLQIILREEDATTLSVRTIHRILDRHGLVSEEAHSAALGRFQRSAPNQLWQMDSKGKYPLSNGECHPLSILDDHSRFAVGLYALSELRSEQAYPCLVETFERYGLPEAMLMDHGALWWSASNGWSLTWLSVRFIEQGIRLLYGRVAHPQTQGKVERFHRTLGGALRHRGVPQRIEEWKPALDEFRQSYNQRRPHEALEMKRPVEQYVPSARVYQPRPRNWEYPEDSEVWRLNTQGSLVLGQERWFVCRALAGQRVRVERFEGKLLVSYRHMYIREVDLATRTTRALVIARTWRKDRNASHPPSVGLQPPCGGCDTENTEAKL